MENTVFQTSISPCFLFPRLFTTPRQVHPLPSEGLGEATLRVWGGRFSLFFLFLSEQSLHFLPLIFYLSSPTLLFLSL